MREPVAPKGVRVRFKDGTSSPVVIRYLGRFLWMHRWEGYLILDDSREVSGVEMDVLPKWTRISLKLVFE